MSDSKKNQGDNSSKKRNLPSWMSSTDNENTSSTNFSKILDGVVFVLSGFVNPERATLRSQALEMGADYKPDWTSDCTLLVCAYSNTPKFRQVEADCGTIVKKEWIMECYKQKKLVEIDSYLMNAGKPWRKSDVSHQCRGDQKASPSRNSAKQVKSGSHSKPNAPASSKSRPSNPNKDFFSSSKVKEWAINDLNRTISWLESQEEKPDPSEIEQIAAEGIIICLQDAIDLLEQNQDIWQITEQWNVVPHAVEELIKLLDTRNASASLPKEDLCSQAKACKEMYEAELKSLDDLKTKRQRSKTDESGKSGIERTSAVTHDAAVYDSDETIEMTEEEINLAYNTVASKLLNAN